MKQLNLYKEIKTIFGLESSIESFIERINKDDTIKELELVSSYLDKYIFMNSHMLNKFEKKVLVNININLLECRLDTLYENVYNDKVSFRLLWNYSQNKQWEHDKIYSRGSLDDLFKKYDVVIQYYNELDQELAKEELGHLKSEIVPQNGDSEDLRFICEFTKDVSQQSPKSCPKKTTKELGQLYEKACIEKNKELLSDFVQKINDLDYPTFYKINRLFGFTDDNIDWFKFLVENIETFKRLNKCIRIVLFVQDDKEYQQSIDIIKQQDIKRLGVLVNGKDKQERINLE